MPRFIVKWSYANMKSQTPALNGSDGVFGFTARSMWEAVPNTSMLRRFAVAASISRRGRISQTTEMSMVGSPHRYFYDVQSTGVTSCHVAVADEMFLTVTAPLYYMEFDLPSVAEDDFTQVLEKLGGERAQHPYYDTDKGEFAEDVTLRGVTTRIAFRSVDH
jgi:hypothetical protein